MSVVYTTTYLREKGCECELVGTNLSAKKLWEINTDKDGAPDKRCPLSVLILRCFIFSTYQQHHLYTNFRGSSSVGS